MFYQKHRQSTDYGSTWAYLWNGYEIEAPVHCLQLRVCCHWLIELLSQKAKVRSLISSMCIYIISRNILQNIYICIGDVDNLGFAVYSLICSSNIYLYKWILVIIIFSYLFFYCLSFLFQLSSTTFAVIFRKLS